MKAPVNLSKPFVSERAVMLERRREGRQLPPPCAKWFVTGIE